MSQRERKEAVFDNIGLQESDSVFEIAFWDRILYPRWIEKFDYLYGKFMRFE